MKWGVATLIFLSAGSACASGFGSAEELRVAHPDFFKPDCVSVVTNKGISYYVCNGCATRFWGNTSAHHDPKLPLVARLRAQNALSKFLLKDESERIIEVSGLLQIAREISEKQVFYVFAVPQGNVKVVSNDVAKAKAVMSVTNAILVGKEADSNRHNVTVSAKISEDECSAEDDWMALLDAVERNPSDARSYARLSEVYLKSHEYDEAEASARRAVELLIPIVNQKSSDVDIESLLCAARVLFQCADYYRAQDAYRAVQKTNRSEFLSETLAGLSKVRLKIGMK